MIFNMEGGGRVVSWCNIPAFAWKFEKTMKNFPVVAGANELAIAYGEF
jgi:hypothetical protein